MADYDKMCASMLSTAKPDTDADYERAKRHLESVDCEGCGTIGYASCTRDDAALIRRVDARRDAKRLRRHGIDVADAYRRGVRDMLAAAKRATQGYHSELYWEEIESEAARLSGEAQT